ncbi:MAG: Bacteriorhodopsin-like protein [uncultured Sphingomonas sp.]|uniref:Bacteriorhodopsin-like protein n=1 Tax=uncultured Sphingomonas sp. TaxID=158754 RepID=A0A6J4STX4_9SPHN|nr:bacteriorhodopsin [uncultured Sphingomonas sp.]CAA9505179.1 MAG: Bacteriorhodopsin-like protein [uncultured Sphingomonas sp.]
MTRNQWLGFGAAAFAIGFVAILAMGRTADEDGGEAADDADGGQAPVKTREEENDKLIHGLVVLTAGTAYLLMASGGGRKPKEEGRELFWMRYVDWSITTPLLLTSLGLTALGTPFRRWGLLLGTLFTDLYMIATGYLADEAPKDSPMKWTWYGVSSGAFVGLYYLLWGPLREESEKTGEEAADVYRRNLTFLSIVWAGYPVNFLIGPEALELIDDDTSTGIYTGLDITAKILFGLYSLSNTQEKARAELADGRVPEHELRPSPAAHHEVWEARPADGRRSRGR